MVVKYVAFDYDGNVAICEINITVPGKFMNVRSILYKKNGNDQSLLLITAVFAEF